MLDHPWLSMPDDYDYKMNDIDYKKYKLRQTYEGIENDFQTGDRQPRSNKRAAEYQEYCPGERTFTCEVNQLQEDETDEHGADIEDNESSVMDSSSDSEGGNDTLSRSFTSDSGKREDEFNLNASFNGGYVPNTDLSRVDKGQGNP